MTHLKTPEGYIAFKIDAFQSARCSALHRLQG
jgi:hypothetical protein